MTTLQALPPWRSEFRGHDLLSREYCSEPKVCRQIVQQIP